MKFNFKNCPDFLEEIGVKNYYQLSKLFNVSVDVLILFERDKQIGYETVKELYNKLGEKTIIRIIDFEKETLDGFKSKFILIGNQLF